MYEDAQNAYEELLRLIEEEEACAVESAHLSAAQKRNDARRTFILAKEKALHSSMKELCRGSKKPASFPNNHTTPTIQINNNLGTNTNTVPTFNQHGNGGQFVAEKMYTMPDASQQSFP